MPFPGKLGWFPESRAFFLGHATASAGLDTTSSACKAVCEREMAIEMGLYTAARALLAPGKPIELKLSGKARAEFEEVQRAPELYAAARGAFNLIYEAPYSGARVFVASLLDRSFEWVRLLGQKDAVIFSDPWNLRESVPEWTQAAAKYPDNLYFLCNDYQTYFERKSKLRNVSVVNQNAFIDENIFTIKGAKKDFDALYNARLLACKRHWLARDVGDSLNLALLWPQHAAIVNDVSAEALPAHVYHNVGDLSPAQVCDVINRSYVGLALSPAEGACFASSEYLLCGVPVVSTPSTGGRSLWYDDENALIVEADPKSVLHGVMALLDAPRDPERIRAGHLLKMQEHRKRLLGDVLVRIKGKLQLHDWNVEDWFASLYLIEEFGFRKDCWHDVATIAKMLSRG